MKKDGNILAMTDGLFAFSVSQDYYKKSEVCFVQEARWEYLGEKPNAVRLKSSCMYVFLIGKSEKCKKA